jgi:hypothetical protein
MRSRFGQGRAGFATPTLLASFLHHHPGGDPSAVAAFLSACGAEGDDPSPSRRLSAHTESGAERGDAVDDAAVNQEHGRRA